MYKIRVKKWLQIDQRGGEEYMEIMSLFVIRIDSSLQNMSSAIGVKCFESIVAKKKFQEGENMFIPLNM